MASTRQLINETNARLKADAWTLTTIGDRGDEVHSVELGELVEWLVCRGLDGRANPALHFELLTELLRVLSLKKASRDDRQERAIEHILEHADVFFGWEDLIERAERGEPCKYQLDRARAWWARGDFRRVHEQRLELEMRHRGDKLAKQLEEHGYMLIEQRAYRRRIKSDLMHALTQAEPAPMSWPVKLIALFTSSRARLTPRGTYPFELVNEDVRLLRSDLVKRWMERSAPRPVAIPHQPLSTIPHESNNIGMIASGKATGGAGIRFHEEDNGQLRLLLYDRKLVLKHNDVPDTFIYIPMPAGSPVDLKDPIGAMLQTLKGMASLSPRARHNQTRDIPRVVAGLFLAATQDATMAEQLGLNPGEFIDAATNVRITNLIGLDSSQNRQTKRVRQVRQWLEKMYLERSVLQLGKNNGRNSVILRAPLIQQLADEYEINDATPEMLRRSERVHVWRMAPDLWRMCNPNSGVASYMLIDQKAFELDSSLKKQNSDPFNLYWALVQRAYNASRTGVPEDKVTEEGSFSPKAKTLYEWSGMELPSDAKCPYRIRERMREYLELMVDHGLLLDWTCPFLETEDVPFDSDVFEHVRVQITLPTSLVKFLPPTAMRAS